MRVHRVSRNGKALAPEITRAQKFEALLGRKRVEILTLLERWPAVEPTPGGPASTHPAEAAADLYEQEETVGVKAFLLRSLAEVDDAVQRLHDGTYGRCEVCGMLIPPARLAAMPTARRRLECQELVERDPAQPFRPGC